MKVKIADFISGFLKEQGVKYVFTVPGGGAMHLNNAFGHQEGMQCIYVQHEQSAAIAAEGYVRMNNELPVVCVTTGPGGTNALTGVLGAWLDSIPMLVISGQVKYQTTVKSTGLPLRALGDQEFDIVNVVKGMTKYSEMISNPKMVKYHLQKALYITKHGRPGPCWLDIPLNIQGGYIDTDDFVEFDEREYEDKLAPKVDEKTVAEIVNRIKSAKRPVLNVGSAIWTAGAKEIFDEVVKKLNIPVVTGWNSIDMMADENELYVGRAGIMGDRAGNFAIQNSDMILSVGSRLGVRQVGYDVTKWAREAFVIMVDVDKAELRKPSIHVEMPVHADVRDFLEMMNVFLGDEKLDKKAEWCSTCQGWKKNYPVVMQKHYENQDKANVYCFIKELSKRLPEGKVTVVGNGSACVVGSHAYVIKEKQRFIINSGAASMGYDLPAAIGVSFALNKKDIICVTGDGSIQMNLQELQTIIHHKLPIKIYVINNGGYHSMRQTQKNFFKGPLVGVGEDSGDISFPSMEKIAYAYGFPYYSCHTNAEIPELMEKTLGEKGALVCEIFVTRDQVFEPKSATKTLSDGTLVSPPLEDLAPFLSRDELEKIMIIPMLEDI